MHTEKKIHQKTFFNNPLFQSALSPYPLCPCVLGFKSLCLSNLSAQSKQKGASPECDTAPIYTQEG